MTRENYKRFVREVKRSHLDLKKKKKAPWEMVLTDGKEETVCGKAVRKGWVERLAMKAVLNLT